MVRLVLVYVGANYFDPITQFVVRCTDFIVKPLRRYVRNFRGIEISTLIIIFALEIIKFLFIALLSFGIPNILGLFILGIGDALKLLIQTFFYAILLQAILSWVQPGSPVNRILMQYTSPIMRPIHRLVPPIGGLDISPIPAMILLQLMIIVIVNPIMAMGMGVAFA